MPVWFVSTVAAAFAGGRVHTGARVITVLMGVVLLAAVAHADLSLAGRALLAALVGWYIASRVAVSLTPNHIARAA
jgi:hypothetical protein